MELVLQKSYKCQGFCRYFYIEGIVATLRFQRGIEKLVVQKKIKNNEVKNVEEKQFISDELEKYDKDLAVEFSQKKSVALTSERVGNVLSNFDCQDYPKIVKAELELLKEKRLIDKITFCLTKL